MSVQPTRPGTSSTNRQDRNVLITSVTKEDDYADRFLFIGNFFDNLSMPPRLANNLFQRNIEGVGREMARFFLNLSMGVLGFFDVATELGIAKSDKDTSQTLSIYGVGSGPCLVLPLLPPLTVRDGIGLAAVGAMNPLSREYRQEGGEHRQRTGEQSGTL